MNPITAELQIDLSSTANIYGPINLLGLDDLHYRFDRGEGSGGLTGVVSFRAALAADDQGGTPTALTMNGTAGFLDVAGAAYGFFVVTTAQAGNTGTLNVYARARPAQIITP